MMLHIQENSKELTGKTRDYRTQSLKEQTLTVSNRVRSSRAREGFLYSSREKRRSLSPLSPLAYKCKQRGQRSSQRGSLLR